jgi:hypothetical protein
MDPLKNLETTGISKERVESMEDRMKIDVLQELKEYDGRMLLHDEEALEKGGFNLLVSDQKKGIVSYIDILTLYM